MWFFVSDLHGRLDRYRKLVDAVARERPEAVLLGGDLLPAAYVPDPQQPSPGPSFLREDGGEDFVADVLSPAFAGLRDCLGDHYPQVFVILGNDDPRAAEQGIVDVGAATGLWHYLHECRATCHGTSIFGYAYVPPTPFLLKDWERYDVSRFVDPGCASPEEGWRSVPVSPSETRYATIKDDLDRLAGDEPLDGSVWLFHAPPYQSCLDRAALDGVTVDHVPLDVHVGSIAIRRFIEARQPRVTLHGHIHESARLTGQWRQQFGLTHAFSAAHDGPELALVRFDPARPNLATRELI